MSEENRRCQFHLSNKQRSVHDLDFVTDASHQTEDVLAANQLYLYADLINHVGLSILEEDIGMQTTHHVEYTTFAR